MRTENVIKAGDVPLVIKFAMLNSEHLPPESRFVRNHRKNIFFLSKPLSADVKQLQLSHLIYLDLFLFVCRSQLCINTAIVYMHRFYAFHSFTLFHRNSIAAAAFFLAAKVRCSLQCTILFNLTFVSSFILG